MILALAPSIDGWTAAQAAAKDTSRRDARIQFVVGNVEYLLVHEIAHFVMTENNVPVIGPSETAADYLATLALIREEPLDAAQADRSLKFLRSTAAAFEGAWRTGSASGADIPYWGAHALSIQRYYQIVCLLYGSNPEQFAGLPEASALPSQRAHDCVSEYRSAERGMQWLLATYGRRPSDPEGAAVEIIYGPPPTSTSAAIKEAIVAIELFERVTERLRQRFTLEQPFTLVMRTCGQAQAAWIPEQRELVICYELLDALYILGIQAETAASGSDERRRR